MTTARAASGWSSGTRTNTGSVLTRDHRTPSAARRRRVPAHPDERDVERPRRQLVGDPVDVGQRHARHLDIEPGDQPVDEEAAERGARGADAHRPRPLARPGHDAVRVVDQRRHRREQDLGAAEHELAQRRGPRPALVPGEHRRPERPVDAVELSRQGRLGEARARWPHASPSPVRRRSRSGAGDAARAPSVETIDRSRPTGGARVRDAPEPGSRWCRWPWVASAPCRRPPPAPRVGGRDSRTRPAARCSSAWTTWAPRCRTSRSSSSTWRPPAARPRTARSPRSARSRCAAGRSSASSRRSWTPVARSRRSSRCSPASRPRC